MPAYFKYWGKAKQRDDGSYDYHLLPYHSLDVAAVGWHLLNPDKSLCKRLALQLEVEPQWLQSWFIFCLALHDLGKYSRAFQNLVPNMSDQLVKPQFNMAYSQRHDSLGLLVWQEHLAKSWVEQTDSATKTSYLQPWLKIVTGHHGSPPLNNLPLNDFFNSEDKIATTEFLHAIEKLFLSQTELSVLASKTLSKKIKQQSWQLAGVAVLADWLGSDQNHFSYQTQTMPLSEYWQQALNHAQSALITAQIEPKLVAPFQSIKQLFPFIEEPTPLQQYALDIKLTKQPQLFMLEDVTGAGKTEAALTLVHRLLDLNVADGVYVALPTMATSNGMYNRLGQAYRKLYQPEQKPSLVLAHGASQFSDQFIQSIETFTEQVSIDEQIQDKNYQQNEPSASAYCSAWVADSRKKALLADVGVGTLDQALLSVLPAKHQSLRLLGLSRKILIIDEVHAYDSYMQGLLETLLEAQANQGGSVILLSATLPFSMRQGLANAFCKGLDVVVPTLTNNDDNYPLSTHIADKQQLEMQLATRKEVERELFVEQITDEQQVIALIKSQARLGKSVCWVRNTVNSAKKSFDELSNLKEIASDKLTLFHSRFAMVDRQRIEAKTLDIFGKHSTAQQRFGQVLVATQVVEQSLDLDFDVMITDLAPVDLVIQRAGRLHRHVRDIQGNRLGQGEVDQRENPVLYLFSPPPTSSANGYWLKHTLPNVEYVYPDLGQLWLTAKLLTEKASFKMPQDARKLIEGVYSPQVQEQLPDALFDSSFEARAIKRQERGIATLNVLKLKKGYCRASAEDNSGWDEDVNIPTRLAEPTCTVALARVENGCLVPYAQNIENCSKAKLWALSCLSLREPDWLKAQQQIPPQWQEEIEQLKAQQPSLKWLEVLPLVGELEMLYSSCKGWGGE